jgi:hypothetical protein
VGFLFQNDFVLAISESTRSFSVKKVDDYYLISVQCTREKAEHVIEWLDGLDLEIDKSQTALNEEPNSLRHLLEICRDTEGSSDVMFELYFPDEESAMLAKLKLG